MKTRIISVILVIVMLIASIGVGVSANTSAEAAAPKGCILDISGAIGIVICGGEIVEQLNLPTVKVTERVVEEVIKQVRVPGPTRTVEVPGPTVFVTQNVAGDTETVTVPGGTETVTAGPGPSALPTPNASPNQPRETVTTTVTATPRQDATEGATIEPDEDEPGIQTDVDLSPPEVVGVGALTLLVLIGLILLAMYGGYIIGYKDRQRNEAKFLKALREQIAIRK